MRAVAFAADKLPTNAIEIPYTKYTLNNGLTLIVHEDHKAPIVAVNVWYHVGSKNEKPGKTGFAHLFEHLMFNGSENFDDDFFKATEKVGATDMNGTTNEDRTNYFENAPKDALDLLLWLESDRMGHLLGAITQAKLDEQRGVVQNEKRQGENQPYGVAYELIQRTRGPPGIPIRGRVIGSMEDLNAASLEDVKEWFKTYYGAANAVLTIAGDVKPRGSAGEGGKVFRLDSLRPARRAPRGMDCQAHRHASPESRRPRAPGAHLQDLEHPAIRHARSEPAQSRQRRAGARQEFALLQAPGLRGSNRDRRAGLCGLE